MPSYENAIAEIKKLVARYGHAVMGVGSDVPCFVCGDGRPHRHHDFEHDPKVDFAYTVGLFKIGYPELILLGFNPVDARGVLNHLVEKMKRQGTPYQDGELISLGGKYPLLAMIADKSETWTDYVSWPKRVFGVEHCSVIQVIGCDKNGRFPPECDPPYSRVPLLTTKPLPIKTAEPSL